MPTRANYLDLVRKAETNGFSVTCPWNASYAEDMVIWNLRLQTAPAMVAYCKKKEDVQLCVRWCRERNFPLLVRSGGHHHEGMSCDYGVLIIDLSLMNRIQFLDKNTAWIQPGKKLMDVYAELAAYKQIIPGGGCETVCVGGLTLGGGWGMYSRALGLTCDSILEAEVVKADGTDCRVSSQENPDLYRAICGGGAGNFGIITNFKFRITNYTSLPKPETESWTWDEAKTEMKKALQSLIDNALPPSTTMACRLFIDSDGVLTFRKTTQVIETVLALEAGQPDGEGMLHFADSKMVSPQPLAVGGAAGGIAAGKPVDTCLTGPLPHKVSSAFAKNDRIMDAGETCYQFLKLNPLPFANAETYISFHSFGGAISEKAPDATAFPYRDRLLLLQFQAWWKNPNDKDTDLYIAWVEDIRNYLKEKELTEGGFFNFQDASISPDQDELMRYYYGENLFWLKEVKKKYDPDNVFTSGMSIPLPLV